MAIPERKERITVEVRRTFAAPREKVFAAWIEKEALEQWMCRDEATHAVRYTELDVRPGGRFVMRITTPKNELYILQGIFQEILRPEKLVFTWSWAKSPVVSGEQSESGDTLMTVEFREVTGGTEVILIHELGPHAGPPEGYDKGWNGCMDLLSNVLLGSGN